MAIVSSVAITAAIATGEVQPADIWRQVGLHPTTELASWLSRPAQLNSEQAIPRLIVQSSRVSSGEPMPLGVALRGRADGAVVIIKGLVPGMDLSVGNAVDTDAWQLLATDLVDAWIAPPEGFVGSTHLVAELRLSDEKMADQQMIQIDWASAIAPPAETRNKFKEVAAGPPILPPRTDREPEEASAPPIAPPPAQRILDREEIAVLLKRGKDLIANGDLSAARLVLRRAADANDAEAALALGATYDPYVLRALKVYGFKADPVMARVWYEKARELGSAVAPRRLEMLASGMR
jgi:TPR repeat protein